MGHMQTISTIVIFLIASEQLECDYVCTRDSSCVGDNIWDKQSEREHLLHVRDTCSY